MSNTILSNFGNESSIISNDSGVSLESESEPIYIDLVLSKNAVGSKIIEKIRLHQHLPSLKKEFLFLLQPLKIRQLVNF